jgi:hypothetical protein
VFGREEIGKREMGEREVEKRKGISSVWYRRETKERDKKSWGPHIFLFSPTMRRK